MKKKRKFPKDVESFFIPQKQVQMPSTTNMVFSFVPALTKQRE